MFKKLDNRKEIYRHNGEDIVVQISTYFYEDSANKYHISFTYNSIKFEEPLGYGDSWEIVARENCMLIDKLGDDYGKYAEYRDKVKKIEKEFLVLADKVYKPHYFTVPHGSRNYHSMSITLVDDNGVNRSIDGSPNPNDEYSREDVYSKNRIESNFRMRVKYQYETSGDLPSEDYFREDKTNEYREMKNWINENSI